MRLADTGRAVLPALRRNSHRLWPLQDGVLTTALELSQATDRALGTWPSTPEPLIIEGPCGNARRFDGTRALIGDSASDAEALGDWTLSMLIRMRAAPAGTQRTVAYAGLSGAVAAENSLVISSVATTLAPQMFWEHGSGTNVSSPATTYRLPLWHWRLLTWRKRNTTGPGPGGVCDLDLIINGVIVETFSGIVNASDGGNSLWSLGASQNGAGAAELFLDNADIGFVLFEDGEVDIDDLRDDVRRLELTPFHHRVASRLVIDDLAGNKIDLTDHEGVDWLDSFEFSNSGDQPTKQATARLFREVDRLSIAPLVETSKLNLSDLADPTSFSRLLRDRGPIEHFAARLPLGINPTPRDWQSMVAGKIDRISWPTNPVVVTFRDAGSDLIRTPIETEREYGDPAGVGFAVQGELQAMLDDNDNAVNGTNLLPIKVDSYDPITLVFPVPPGWDVIDWTQRREPVLAGLKTAMQQIGWEVRIRFNPATQAHELTAYEPDRAKEDGDFVLAPDDIIDVKDATLDGSQRRNVMRITYASSETPFPGSAGLVPADLTLEDENGEGVDSEDNRLPAQVTLRDGASSAAIGRLFMELAEITTPQIDTVVEVVRMIVAALRDLAGEELLYVVESINRFEIELQDMGLFLPNQTIHTSQQRLAVHTITHTFGEQSRTVVGTRGAPSLGFHRWLELEARAGQGRPPNVDANGNYAEESFGKRLEALRSLNERTAQMRGGKFTQTFNSDFSSTAKGDKYPPPGWTGTTTPTRVWDTDYRFEKTVTKSGGRSVAFLTDITSVASDLVSIQDSLPLSVEFTVARSDSTQASFMEFGIEVFDKDKVQIALLATFTPTLTEADNVFETRRTTNIIPPATARFARIVGVANIVGGSLLYLDSAAFYRTSNETRATLSELSQPPATDPGVGQRGLPDNPGGGTFTLIELDDVSTGAAHDYGGQFVLGTNSIDMKQDGLYNIKAKVSFTVQDNLNDAPDWGVMRIDINGVEWKRGQAGIKDHVPAGQEMIHSELDDELFLNKGDSLTISTFSKGAVAQALSGANMTFLFLKLISSE